MEYFGNSNKTINPYIRFVDKILNGGVRIIAP